MTTAKFEVGRTYAIERRHMGVWGERKVVSRTEKTITVLDEVSGQMAKRKLHTDERGEYIYLDSGTKKMRCSAVFVELFVKNETTGEWIYRGKKTMTKTELEGLYEALEGKTERTEIEVVLKKATVATLKEYMKKEMYFDESWKGWRKADFIEEISHYLENRALFSEVRESLEGITVSEEKIEKIADGIAPEADAEAGVVARPRTAGLRRRARAIAPSGRAPPAAARRATPSHSSSGRRR